MKKLNYLFLALVMGLATIACSNDKDNDPKPTAPEAQPTAPETQPTAPAPVANVSSVKVNYDEGFYNLVSLTRNDEGKVISIKESSYTPEDVEQGEATELELVYEDNAVVISNEEAVVVYTLDESGKVIKSATSYLEDGEEYLLYEIAFSYSEAGMLNEVVLTSEEEGDYPIFSAEYGEDNNMTAVIIDEEEVDVAVGTVANPVGMDCNLILFMYGFFDEIDYAILSGMIPSTPNIISSCYGGYMTIQTTQDDNGNVTSFTLDEDGEIMCNYEFAY